MVLTVFVALFFAFLSSDRQAKRVLDEERVQARLAAQSLEASASIQDMHRNVESFLLTRNVDDLLKFDARLAHLQSILGELWEAEDAASITAIQGHIDNYANFARRIISLRRKLGLKHDEGIEGRLRDAAHDVESILVANGEENLLVDLLMLRRHEKDFIMRREQRYIDSFDTRMESFHKVLNASELSQEDRLSVDASMRAYSEGFREWAKFSLLMANAVSSSQESYQNIVELIAALTEREISSAEYKSHRRMEAEHRTDIMLVLMVVVMLASGSMLVAMVIRYRRFFRRGRGVGEQRLPDGVAQSSRLFSAV